ncbi:MAG: hypothetical protein V4569_11370 [Pseudomonadota bacterium]
MSTMHPSEFATDAEVGVTRGIVYGRAGVGFGSRPVERELKLDLYRPPHSAGAPPHPVIVLAFGGAFHRGQRDNDAFEGGNTAIADYCRAFAARGFVACAIDYRLVPEDPVPGDTPVLFDPRRIPRSRVDHVRALMGLPPATDEMLWRGIEAASDDMAMAARFVIAQAAEWHLDPDRLVLGGFSAGARTALNAAFAEQVRCAAVVSLSGYIDPIDLAVHAGRLPLGPRPAVLLVRAERDLDYIRAATPAMAEALRALGAPCECATVPGHDHFYPAAAPALHETRGSASVGAVAMAFVDRALAASARRSR